tara:strand:- start:57 stop:641 length:585 start_codon:yes stop_codon:yes gene_type:complete
LFSCNKNDLEDRVEALEKIHNISPGPSEDRQDSVGSAILVDSVDSAILVKILAEKYNWTARYAGLDNILGDSVRDLFGNIVMDYGKDDIISKEIHLPVGKEIILIFSSKDVIHSAYMPHFRLQSKCVPNLDTQLTFTPTLTTKEYQEYLQDTAFQYMLLCNQGGSCYKHFTNVIIETEEEYNHWITSQKTVSDN